jgi:hypothetical protein
MLQSLRSAPLSTRVFAVTLLLTLGVGYALSLVYLYVKKVEPHRVAGHGLVQGVAYNYHGIEDQAPLLTALEGSMGNFVDPDQLRAIDRWIGTGATETVYRAEIEPILAENCVSCHAEGKYDPPLTSFEEVSKLTEAGRGIDVAKLARTTHVHVLGIPLLFFVLGALFVHTRFGEGLKSVIVVVPFVGIALDISHWWLTRHNPSHAVGIVIGGMLMSLGFGMMWLMTFYDVCAPLDKGTTAARTGRER